MRNKHKIIICLILFSIPFIFSAPYAYTDDSSDKFHTEEEVKAFMAMINTLSDNEMDSLFITSNRCEKCHGFDTAGIASVDPLGNDINVYDDWESTLMANSAKDPFWRAKVSHEVLLYPQHKAVIEDKCTSCHAPMGHYNALHAGLDPFSMEDLLVDSLALDGVGCLACHQQTAEAIGSLHSGILNFDTNQVAYGPFISPLASPMIMETGYAPVFSPHISDAGLCAGCHTLITETINYAGNFTGNTFVEQATYHEWLNSSYSLDNVTCQNCHFPLKTKGVFHLIAGLNVPPRDSFYVHEMAGANTLMLQLMKNNSSALGITASPEAFDQTIAATEAMLKTKTLDLAVLALDRTQETASFEVSLSNKAGHKFPSGYPARRAYIEFVLTNEMGDTLFASGKTDETFEVIGHNSTYEPHYDTIKTEDQIQIYELVIADVNGDVTTVLERGDYALKDNRLTPLGFSTSHSTYDTTLIAGAALDDPNFNHGTDGMEGSGSDKIIYQIPLNGNNDKLFASAQVFYQSMPPKWMQEMFAETTPEIEDFRTMFDEADRSPLLMKTANAEMEALPVNTMEVFSANFIELLAFDPIHHTATIKADENHELFIYDLSGHLWNKTDHIKGTYQIPLPNYKGVLLLYFKTKTGISSTKKVLLF